MRKALLLLCFSGLLITSNNVLGQWVNIDEDGGAPDASAALEINSTDRGVLFPRMNSTQMSAITSPRNGLTVFNTDSTAYMSYDSVGGSWVLLGSKAAKSLAVWKQDANGITYNNTSASTVGIGNSSTSGVAMLEVSTPTGNTKEHGIIVNHNEATGAVTGIESVVKNTVNATKTGFENSVTNTAFTSADILGIDNYVTSGNNTSTGNTYAFRSKTASQGTGIDYGLHITGEDVNYFSNQFLVGTTSNTSGFGVFASPKDKVFPYTLIAVNNFTGALEKRGLDVNVTVDGLGEKYGVYAEVNGNASQANAIYGNYMDVITGNGESAYVAYNRIPSTAKGGAGKRYGLYNDLFGDASQTGGMFGTYNQITPKNAEDAYGTYNSIGGDGTGAKFGSFSTVNSGTTAKSYGITSDIQHNSSGESILFDGGFTGTGVGTRTGLKLDLNSGGTGTKYGIYVTNEDENYFSGNVGIGTTTITAPLHVYDASTNVKALIETGGASSNATLDFKGNSGTWSLGYVNTEFRLSYSFTNMFTIETNGDVGIGTFNPSEKLDVEGSIQIDSAYAYESAQTRYLSVSATGFTPLESTSGSNALNTIGIGGFTTGNARWIAGGSTLNDGYLYSDISLPDGALITEVIFYIYDNSTLYEVSGELRRQTFGSTTSTLIAQTPTSGVLAAPATTSISDNTISTVLGKVDNANYSYYLKFNTKENNSDLRLYGVRVTYTVTEAR